MKTLINDIINPFDEHASFNIKMYDFNITKPCKKINLKIFRDYMTYSLQYNNAFFQNYEVHIVGGFNSTNRKNTMDLDMQVVVDSIVFLDEFSEEQKSYLDTLYNLYKIQMDISFNIFQVYSDIIFLDRPHHILDDNRNYMHPEMLTVEECTCFLQSYADEITTDDVTINLHSNKFYKCWERTLQNHKRFTQGKQLEQFLAGIKKYDTIIKTVDDIDKIYMPE